MLPLNICERSIFGYVKEELAIELFSVVRYNVSRWAVISTKLWTS